MILVDTRTRTKPAIQDLDVPVTIKTPYLGLHFGFLALFINVARHYSRATKRRGYLHTWVRLHRSKPKKFPRGDEGTKRSEGDGDDGGGGGDDGDGARAQSTWRT